MQNLFPPFPRRWQAATLLILRTALAAEWLAATARREELDGTWQALALAGAALLLLAGFLTPLVAILLIARLVLGEALHGWGTGRWSPPELVPLTLAGLLVLVTFGPGTFSVDCWLYGQRRVIVPPRPGEDKIPRKG